jgi:flagellar hook-length control protein FliK
MQGLPLPTEPTLPNPGFEVSSKGSRHRSGLEDRPSQAAGEPFSTHFNREDHRSSKARPDHESKVEAEENPPVDSPEDPEEVPAGSADQAQDAPETTFDSEEDPTTSEGTSTEDAAGHMVQVATALPQQQTEESLPQASVRTGTQAASRPEADAHRPMPGAPAPGVAGTPSTPGSIELDPSLQSVQPRTAAREDLASLLEEYGVRTARGKAVSGGGHAAVARAEQVQQAIALEQAAQMNPGTRALPGGMQSVSLDTNIADARQGVLNSLPLDDPSPDALQQRIGRLTGRALGALASQRGGTLTMRLDPPNLGQITLKMSVVDSTVRTEIMAQNKVARQLLDRSIDTLRMTLESRGLQVDRLAVTSPSAHAETSGTRSESHQQQPGGGDPSDDGKRDAAGSESRGRRERHDAPDTSENPSDRSFQETLSPD